MGGTPLCMALLTFGTNITQARGSAGGSVYSRNKGGAYLRARITPANPKTVAQMKVRNTFAANAKAWSGTLTAAQRLAWTNFAIANPLVNILGATITVSGLAMYQKLNQVLAQIGSANISDPPADLSVPANGAATGITMDSTTGVFTIVTAAQVTAAGMRYYVFATKALPPGRQPGTSDFRYITTVAAVAAATTLDISVGYYNTFGAGTPGANVGVLVATVNIATGAVTPGLRFAALMT